jgi:hypothetical protein
VRVGRSENEMEMVREAALDELLADIERELGRLSLEQRIAIERAVVRYRKAIGW